MAYTTLQDILEESGLANHIHGETPTGIVDGENMTFTAVNKPLVDTNYDDEVTKDDIQLYFDGVPADVSEIDARFGTATVTSAPDEGVEVTMDYCYSAVSMTFVGKLREEAEEFINNRMKLVDSCVPYGENGHEVPKTVRNLTRQLAAAWLLIREYGFNQDIEGTSKDGYKRLEAVEESLEKYASAGGECGSDGAGTPNGGLASLATTSDGDLFPRPDFNDTPRPEKDW